jgi:hypothetical protein
VTPAMGKVPTGHSCRGPCLCNEIVQRPRSVTTAETAIPIGVGEQVRGLGESRPHPVLVLPEHFRQQVWNGDHPSSAALADGRPAGDCQRDELLVTSSYSPTALAAFSRNKYLSRM